LLQAGPYNFSRNPIYLAMVLFCAGLAIVLNSLWIIIALVPAILTVHFHVITREEQHLTRQFGQDFTDYRNRVRRWI
ncbi:MAG: isoprenylcysteine carboxylmethyltransferase family protein, partial [Gammaproteobacteria bacterium]|nr:isoprenylcysteine carboxylmethyltransferase family protein [Gammaproteobacteria bacterium]